MTGDVDQCENMNCLEAVTQLLCINNVKGKCSKLLYLRGQIHVMGKKRKVAGEDGELAKEAAAHKVPLNFL